MRYIGFIISGLIFVIICLVASLGLVIHRTHAISVTAKIVNSENGRLLDRALLQNDLDHIGSVSSYYSVV